MGFIEAKRRAMLDRLTGDALITLSTVRQIAEMAETKEDLLADLKAARISCSVLWSPYKVGEEQIRLFNRLTFGTINAVGGAEVMVQMHLPTKDDDFELVTI